MTRSVLITGSSRGLGQSLALAFARRRYQVGLNYVGNKSRAEETALLVEKAGGKALLLQADVSQSSQVNSMMETAAKQWGRIDVLVNNAGIAKNRFIVKMSDEEWRDVLSVILDGAFYCTRAVLPVMREQKEGSIINIASYLATHAPRGSANYAVAKAGLIMLTQCTAQEEGKNNIRANAILPGFHLTDMNKDIWPKIEAHIREQHLLGRLPEREEMADFVAYVAGLTAVTGQVFAFESRLA